MYTKAFTDEGASELAEVGGKGANLGRLAGARFVVPAGFSVTTRAYRDFLSATGLDGEIEAFLARADFGDPAKLEDETARLRTQIEATDLPEAIAEAVTHGYRSLRPDGHVAVRSSATAEDLPGASYAGLHDTYLDLRGEVEVLAGVKRCWASLWTARAASYRNTQEVDQARVDIAVVVQTMVEAEVAGVMFTGNPLTTATDEIVVNANWGLGESVVSGVATPDEFILNLHTLKVKRQQVGAKEVWIRRDPTTGTGTITEAVPGDRRTTRTLSDEQLAELGRIGRRVQEHYDGIPQDIEWAYADGHFHLLQARPITGVEFSWDSDVELGLWDTEDDEDGIWSRNQADENWTGAISPLMYSYRAPMWSQHFGARVMGFEDMGATRYWKFYKSEAYYNCSFDEKFLTQTLPTPFRKYVYTLYNRLPQQRRPEVMNAPFRWTDYLRMIARIETLNPRSLVGHKKLQDYIDNRLPEARGLTSEELGDLSDSELKNYLDKQMRFEVTYTENLWHWFWIYARDAMGMLGYIMVNWYDGSDEGAAETLLTGTPQRTATVRANHAMWSLAERLRTSEPLMRAFRAHQGAEFLAELDKTEEGRAWLAEYWEFLGRYGAGGHSDRDLYFPRRAEDPMIDYAAFQAMLSGDGVPDPSIREEELARRRAETTEAVIANLRAKPLGSLRVEIFKIVLNYCQLFLMGRDNERNFVDVSTYSIRRGFLEIARRLDERGVIDEPRQVFFLSIRELYDLFDGRANLVLTRAKMQARGRNFDHFNDKEYQPPPYIQRGEELDLDAPEQAGDVLKGTGTARGSVTATARLARKLSDIGRVRHGEILIVNSTDPGWTPVFNVISGIVLETGGMTAHGSLLAREYGLPAVQLPNALSLIPDGATITVNGTSGVVTLVDD